MIVEHIHDVSDGPCDFCLQSPAVSPRVRTRSDASTEVIIRQAQARINLWLRGPREGNEHIEWALALLGDALYPED